MFGTALMAAIVVGGWHMFTTWPLQIYIAWKQEESVIQGYILGALFLIHNVSQYPLIIGGLTGLVLGDFSTGLMVGALIQLMFLGVFIVGAAIPPQPKLSTVLCVVYAISAGLTVEQVLAFAIPIAVLSQFILFIGLTVNAFFYQKFALQPAEKGDIKKLELSHAILQPVIMDLGNAIPAFLGVYFGTELVARIVGAMPGWLLGGLFNVGGVLPILGFGLLVFTMNPGILMFLFVIGFILGALLLQLPPLTAAVLAVAVVVIIQYIKPSENDGDVAVDAGDIGSISLKNRVSLFWRNQTWFRVASWDVLGGWGFGYQMVPVIRELYTDVKDRASALTRHIAFWNTNVHAGALIPGMVLSMEKAHAEDPNAISVEAIQGIKIATMGPLAGVGDSLYHATLAPLFLALGTTMVIDSGNAFGWFFSFVTLFLIYGASIWYLLGVGNNFGARAFTVFKGVTDKFAEGARMTGLLMAGFMVARLANLAFKISYTAGEQVIDFQGILDSFMPKLPVLGGVFLIYWLLRKGVTAIWLVLGLMAFTIALTYFGLI